MSDLLKVVFGTVELVNLAWDINKQSHNYFSNVKGAKQFHKRFQEEIISLTNVLLRAETTLRDVASLDSGLHRPSSLSVDVISSCHKQLTGVSHELQKHPLESPRSLYEEQMEKHIDALQHINNIFSSFLAASMPKTTTHSHVEKMIQEKERDKVLSWLDSSECIRQCLPSPYLRTGKWLLDCDTYRTWRDGAPSLLWCHGSPGTGKSHLSATIIRDLSVQRHSGTACITHFFCDFSARTQQRTDTILRSLLLQVAEQEDLSVLEALNQMRISISRIPDMRDLEKAFSLACSTSTSGMFLILDAPDELDNPKEVIELLQSFVQAGCKVCIMSRYTPDIRSSLSSATQIEIRASREDMVRYAEARFQESDFRDAFNGGKHEDIIEEVVGKADGIFLLANLLLDQLLDLHTIRQIRKALPSLPTQVIDAFQYSISMIEAQPADQRELAYRLVGWITHSHRRLKAVEIIHAFALEEDADEIDEENCLPTTKLLDTCAGLVIQDTEDGTIGMIHVTAYKFFRDHLSHRNASIQLDMAKTSLLYLNSREMISRPCKSLEEMELRITNLPFLPYAARYWRKHVVDSDAEQHLHSLVMGILDDQRLRDSVFQVLQFCQQLNDQRRGPSHGTFEATIRNPQALHLAAYWDLSKITGDLLSRGDDSSPVDSNGWTPLHWASLKSNRSVAGLLISGGANVNLKDSQGWTPLFWTAVNGDVGLMRELFENDASHLVRDANGWSALMHAISRRQRSVVEVLLKHGKRRQLEVQDLPPALVGSLSFEQARGLAKDSPTTIEIAAGVEDAYIFNLVLEPHLKEKRFQNLWSPGRPIRSRLNSYKFRNNGEMMQGQDYYINLHLRRNLHLDQDWKTWMLHAAIKDEKPLILKALLELGTDANTPLGPLSQAPLHTAACRPDPQYTEFLLQHGANPSQENRRGFTPLHLAIANGFPATVKKLLEWKSDPDTATCRGPEEAYERLSRAYTPLMIACGLREDTSGDGALEAAVQITDLLLLHGADVCAKDGFGKTCLYYAIKSGITEIVKRFLAAGADVTSVKGGTMGLSALHYAAAWKPNIQIIKMLIDAGADGSAIDDLGRNVFHHLASGNGCAQDAPIGEIVDALVAHCGLSAMNAEWTVRSDSYAERSYRAYPAREIVGCFFTPAALALVDCQWAVFEALRSRGAIFHTDCRIQDLQYPLREAISKLQPDIISFLLDRGTRLSLLDFRKVSPVRVGAWGPECQRGRNYPFDLNELSRDPQKASRAIRLLPSMGININLLKLGLHPPCLYAASNLNCEKTTQSLLDAGGDPSIVGRDGYDAYLQATVSGNSETLHCLLNYARTHPKEGHWTAFLQAQTSTEKQQDSVQVFDALRRAGVLDESYYKSYGKTTRRPPLLCKFAEIGKKEEVRQLLALGASVKAVDNYGWTALHQAALNGHDEIAELLVQSGADVHARTTRCTNPWRICEQPGLYSLWNGQALQLAAISGNASIVGMLLAHNADPNANSGIIPGKKTRTGPMPLRIALNTTENRDLHDGRLRIAQMLVEHGADVRRAADFLSVEDVARFEKYPGLWEKLRQGISDEGQKIPR